MSIATIERELIGDTNVYDAYGKYVESAFQRMKQLAVTAGWPASLTPQIIAIDKEWQKVKEDANAARLSTAATAPPVLAKMDAMSTRLKAYMADRGPSYTPPAPTPASAYWTPKPSDTSAAPVPSAKPADPSAASSPDAKSADASEAPASSETSASSMLDVFKHRYGPLPLWGWGLAGAGAAMFVYYWKRGAK